MEQPKVLSQSDIMWNPWYRKYYYKKEVDSVLAEKDKVIAELENNLSEIQSQNRQLEDDNDSLLQQNRELCQALQVMYSKEAYDKQKYKRCLAMAKWCESEENRLEAISPIFDTDKEYWEYNSDYWGKWHNRWRELAEKFKEAK